MFFPVCSLPNRPVTSPPGDYFLANRPRLSFLGRRPGADHFFAKDVSTLPFPRSAKAVLFFWPTKGGRGGRIRSPGFLSCSFSPVRIFSPSSCWFVRHLSASFLLDPQVPFPPVNGAEKPLFWDTCARFAPSPSPTDPHVAFCPRSHVLSTRYLMILSGPSGLFLPAFPDSIHGSSPPI